MSDDTNDRPDPTVDEADAGPIDEIRVAELESIARAATVIREAASRPTDLLAKPRVIPYSGSEAREAREEEAKAHLEAALARADLEMQKRVAADAATVAMIEANREMAAASRDAARASADAARWAKWAAIFTAAGTAITAWVAMHPK
jgi:hypothetical protein